MKWQGRRQSGNVTDMRGRGGGLGGGGMAAGGLGCGGIALMLIIALLTGVNPLDMMGGGGGGAVIPYEENSTERIEMTEEAGQDDELKAFSSTVFADLEDVWGKIFSDNNMQYNYPQLVLYQGVVNTACGQGSSNVGPFYCGGDHGVYIDPNFYNQLHQQYGAPGDFAYAYVIAHEVGHHVQNELGILEQVQGFKGRVSEKRYNEYSVRLELQSDYFAGVFARHIEGKGYLEPGDIQEAQGAASAVGDDVLQERMTGRVMPDNFTHGTAEQRQRWFMKGFESGTLKGGDTFNIPYDEL